jgi:hypothetical protein
MLVHPGWLNIAHFFAAYAVSGQRGCKLATKGMPLIFICSFKTNVLLAIKRRDPDHVRRQNP